VQSASEDERLDDANVLGARSTRIGTAHDMVAAGIDLTSIMHAGGWNDPKMPRWCTRELAAKDSGMARLVKTRHPQRVVAPSIGRGNLRYEFC
jgi:hypothetical protein